MSTLPAPAGRTRSNSGFRQLLTGLSSVSGEDAAFLKDLFEGQSLHLLLKIHQRLQQHALQGSPPGADGAATLAHELATELRQRPTENPELLRLLSEPHVKALLLAHDDVALKRYAPPLPPLPNSLDSEEESVKIICLAKGNEPLGATVKRDEGTGAIFVARLMRGGAADRSGLIREGDELLEINGVPIKDKYLEEIIPVLALCHGAITLKLVPTAKDEAEMSKPMRQMFVRSLFDYNPNEDEEIPCKEAGLAFQRGDILHVVSQDDANWWQAKHFAEAQTPAALVPSSHVQMRRLALQKPSETVFTQSLCDWTPFFADVEEDSEDVDYGSISGIHIAGLRASFRMSRRNWRSSRFSALSQWDEFCLAAYEEVVQHRWLPGKHHRLVLLVGPAGVGITELKRKLVISDPLRFAVPVPHTTRPRGMQEKEGVEYHFIPKHLFVAHVVNNKFVEHGEHRGHFYGMSLDAVRQELARDRVCLLDVHPRTIQHLRTAELKPFVIFVKPPPIERLRLTRRKAKVLSGQTKKGTPALLLEKDFQEMLERGREMEARYGHLFDKVLINDDAAAALRELNGALNHMETQEQWTPVSWLSP